MLNQSPIILCELCTKTEATVFSCAYCRNKTHTYTENLKDSLRTHRDTCITLLVEVRQVGDLILQGDITSNAVLAYLQNIHDKLLKSKKILDITINKSTA